jgi:hypothetical protein
MSTRDGEYKMRRTGKHRLPERVCADGCVCGTNRRGPCCAFYGCAGVQSINDVSCMSMKKNNLGPVWKTNFIEGFLFFKKINLFF